MRILGEALIQDADSAAAFAAQMHEEAATIMDRRDCSEWSMMQNSSDFLHESIRIDQGAFRDSNIFLTRTKFVVRNALPSLLQIESGESSSCAKALFRLITSPEGFAIIDPFSDPEDFAKYIEKFDAWRVGADQKLEVGSTKFF